MEDANGERPIRKSRKLGQCFLSDFRFLNKEARIISPDGKRVLEIGPGDGRLSERLLTAKELILVEKDPRFAALLREKFAQKSNVRVIEGDFLELEPFDVDLVAGNLPYYISSDITFRLVKWKFRRAVLMFQKEFARKLCARGREMSRISFFAQHYFSIREHITVPKTAFRPRPKVDSALIELVPTGAPQILPDVHEAITALFQHRQKQLASSIRMYCKGRGLGAESVLSRLRDKGIPLNKRIFQLSRDEIMKIGKEISA
ncbi:MAG: 16S rRNA (adenine(1518)-N(6)/adenine(1519)-N(6))-dimethyltransferase RsmA [Candidatus Micrarchaeota archaeon]|nr:16S rRNA (adenine(1518)-N(6)/adenine(1519)-N(6))-dimethyltransferase RsmA [Candidatus Micrarchaeota archaeon]